MLNERLLVYDVLDDYPVNYKSIKIRKLISRTDRFLQTKADIVFALTHHLVEKIKRINPNTFFIPGSADVSFFMRANDPNLPVPKDLQSIAKPRIGLIGHITDRVDMELIRFLAETHPDWSIVFIGELKGTRKFLHSLSLVKTLDMVNVHYLGFRDYTSLPNYLKGLDVCLLPYKINRDTINIYPNKLHQYFSGGKPVVSTSLPEVQYFSDVVVIAKNYEEFSDSITTYLKENNPEQVGIRIEVAKEYSVEIRGKNIFDIICENILKRC